MAKIQGIDGIWKTIYHDMSMRNAGGADMRILSAIIMAQLDIVGKIAGVPAYRLLGGKTRPKVKVYNTVTDYNMKMGQDTEKIVKFLLDRGIIGMKIYPFSSKDDFITSEELENCIYWLKQIRNIAGNEMEILIDCWGRYDFPSSQRILKAIEPYNVIYMEDMMVPTNSQQAYSILAAAIPNFCYLESNYWKYAHQYPYFLNNVPVPVNGYVKASGAPGLGAEICSEIFSNGDAIVETIAELNK